MARMVSAREIVGRRIVAFDPGATTVGRGVFTRVMHTPRITLDDGSILAFTTEEHPGGDSYGTHIIRAPAPQRKMRG